MILAIIPSRSVSEPSVVQEKLSNLMTAYEELRSDVFKRSAALEAALPLSQRLTTALTTLSMRLPASESRLKTILDGPEPTNVKRSAVDHLEKEHTTVLAPQFHVAKESWSSLQRQPQHPVLGAILTRPLSQTGGTVTAAQQQQPGAELSRHTDQIEAELERFTRFSDEVRLFYICFVRILSVFTTLHR